MSNHPEGEPEVTTDPTKIAALEAELAAAKSEDKRPELSVVDDPALNAAFAEGAGDAPGYDGIEPAADPDDETEEETPDPDGVTAFLVVLQADGSAQISTDLKLALTVLREANLLDVRRACDEILFNLRNQAVSENTVMLMHQTGQQLAEQARIQKVQQKLASKGIQVPGRG